MNLMGVDRPQEALMAFVAGFFIGGVVGILVMAFFASSCSR
jgi:hypothetical protein